jgi:hypothetical protein
MANSHRRPVAEDQRPFSLLGARWGGRGMLDEVRCELWSVEGTRMLRTDLLAWLRIKPTRRTNAHSMTWWRTAFSKRMAT